MRVILVGPQLEENLSLGYLQSALQSAGHTCVILPFNRAEEVPRIARRILRKRPGLVGFSLVAQRRYPEFQRLIGSLRADGFAGHLTAGGHFAGLRAEEVLRDTPGLDTVLHHDGEARLVSLAGHIRASAGWGFAPPLDLDGVSWRQADGTIGHRPVTRVAELDDLPPPARRRPMRTVGYAMAPMVTSRGCSGSCSFCSIHAWHRSIPHGRLRFRSPRNVAAEMIALHRAHGTRVFVFHDDDFVHPDPRAARARCRAILDPVEREIGPIAFVLKCRPDDVDAELFAYFKARGLVRAYVGIESHSRAGLRALNRRLSPETNERALAILRELDVYACFNLLVFHPDSNPSELEENLAFLERQADVPFDVARTELYARSTLEDRMVREGRARGDYRGYDYRIADPTAEAAFRLFAELLWERHFGGASILHRAQELGYRLSLLRRFQPGMATRDLSVRVQDLIRAVNRDTVDHLRALLAEARRSERMGSSAGAEGAAFRWRFREQVGAQVRQQRRTWQFLSWEIEGRSRIGRLGLAPGRLSRIGGPLAERMARLAPGAVLLVGASCGLGDGTEVCDPPPPPAVRFSTELEPVFDTACGRDGCHAGETPSADLNLEAGRSFDALVGVPSTQAAGRMRVQPGWADSSYLMNKLEGTQSTVGGSGDRMPREGSVPSGWLELVRRWIWEGAERNKPGR